MAFGGLTFQPGDDVRVIVDDYHDSVLVYASSGHTVSFTEEQIPALKKALEELLTIRDSKGGRGESQEAPQGKGAVAGPLRRGVENATPA